MFHWILTCKWSRTETTITCNSSLSRELNSPAFSETGSEHLLSPFLDFLQKTKTIKNRAYVKGKLINEKLDVLMTDTMM